MLPFIFPSLDYRTHEFWLWEKQFYTFDAESAYKAFWRTFPNHVRHCHLPGAIVASSKGRSITLPIWVLSDLGEHGKTSIFHVKEPIFTLLWQEVYSWDRSNTLWNTSMVYEALCKSTDGTFGRSITRREGKSISRISMYANKNLVGSLFISLLGIPFLFIQCHMPTCARSF